MLKKAWTKIDRFYTILAIVLLILAAPVIYTALGIFSAIITAHELDASGSQVRINKARLDQAIVEVYDKDVPALEVRETSISVVNIENEENENERGE
jgi:cell division protein FtsL